jgi:hypothetical protein
MPDFLDLAKLSEDERNMVWRLFSLRFKIWDGQSLSNEDGEFWATARAEVPAWALFHRLELSADDREARKKSEGDIEKEFEEFFGEADQVELTDKGHGLQGFSATFDFDQKAQHRNVSRSPGSSAKAYSVGSRYSMHRTS